MKRAGKVVSQMILGGSPIVQAGAVPASGWIWGCLDANEILLNLPTVTSIS